MHHRTTGTALRGLLATAYRKGYMDYTLGVIPAYEILKCGYRIMAKPAFIGSILRIAGYTAALLRRQRGGMPPEVVRYYRREQWRKLNPLRWFAREPDEGGEPCGGIGAASERE